jgi:chlorobactene glucosyltransferase
VASLLAQDYPADRLELVVVDDNSTDGTAALAGSLEHDGQALAVVPAGPLPKGWVGKPHGCAVGAGHARQSSTWLCFIDADVRLVPAALATALAHAEWHGIDMLCLSPRQELVGPLERLIIPCGMYALAFTKHFEAQSDDGHGAVAATGQFMLVRRAAYDAVGGHASVAGAIAEDLQIARRFAAAGFRVRLLGGERLASVRMYRDGHALWDGFAKNLVELFGTQANTIAIAVVGFALAWAALLLPACELAFTHSRSGLEIWAAIIAILASAAIFAFHVAGAIFLRIPFWYGLVFPVGYTLAALLALDSARRRSGGITRWKGRIYP